VSGGRSKGSVLANGSVLDAWERETANRLSLLRAEFETQKPVYDQLGARLEAISRQIKALEDAQAVIERTPLPSVAAVAEPVKAKQDAVKLAPVAPPDGLTVKQRLTEWARAHGRRVVVGEVADAWTAEGRYGNRQAAYTAAYTAFRDWGTGLAKVAPGVYEVLVGADGEVLPSPEGDFGSDRWATIANGLGDREAVRS
jgi:hypothetical protein